MRWVGETQIPLWLIKAPKLVRSPLRLKTNNSVCNEAEIWQTILIKYEGGLSSETSDKYLPITFTCVNDNSKTKAAMFSFLFYVLFITPAVYWIIISGSVKPLVAAQSWYIITGFVADKTTLTFFQTVFFKATNIMPQKSSRGFARHHAREQETCLIR